MTQEKKTPKIDDQAKVGVRQLSELHEKLILKARSNPAFKKELLADPAKAVEKAFGIKIPGFLKLKVIEETADTRYITLPFHAEADDRPLADEELDRIAGGDSGSVEERNPIRELIRNLGN
ncbi:MAG: NHLP leader peptide family RiPP precursor [Candidatus Ozemobacteraceae bacterium]